MKKSSLPLKTKIELILLIISVFALFYTCYVLREVAVNPETTGYPFRETIFVSMGISGVCLGTVQLIDKGNTQKFSPFVGIIAGTSSLVLYFYFYF